MTKHPEATPQNLYQITGNVADINTVLIERSELRRLHEENQTLREKNGLLKYALTERETLQAENAELEAMLGAVGAGGVGQSIQPPVQTDTAAPAAHQEPVGYMRWKNGSAEYVTRKHLEHPDDEDWHAVYTATQPTENLNCKSNQKRLATLWGYVKQEPARQPLTNDEIDVLWAKEQTKPFKSHGETRVDFARAIEQAHGITGEKS